MLFRSIGINMLLSISFFAIAGYVIYKSILRTRNAGLVYFWEDKQRHTIGFVLASDWEQARHDYWKAVKAGVIFPPTVQSLCPAIHIPKEKMVVVYKGDAQHIAILNDVLGNSKIEQRPFFVTELPNDNESRYYQWLKLYIWIHGYDPRGDLRAPAGLAERIKKAV